MSQPLQEFFALEVGEYLARLERLVADPDPPDADRLLRLVRSVRGSARVAEAHEVARVASGLEAAVRALRDGRLTWDGDVRARAAETVADLRTLVGTESAGHPADPALADAAVERWRGVVAPDTPEPSAEKGRMEAFVERELAGVLTALDRALAGFGDDPWTIDELRPLLQRMRPIRGLSGVAALAPVMEVLEEVEEVARELLAGSRAAEADDQERLQSARTLLAELRHGLTSGGGRPVLPPADATAEPVPIGELELRGDAALRAALQLRPRLEGLAGEDPALGSILGELWELLELALREEV